MRLPKHRPPTSPGDMLRYEFLEPANLSQAALARHLGWLPRKLNEIIKGKRAITPATALDLADVFCTSPAFWLNLQVKWDLWQASQDRLQKKPLPLAS